MNPVAVNLLHHSKYYRRERYARGLERVGYTVTFDRNHKGRPGDLLLLWNRNPSQHRFALEFERNGGTVIITENGYLGDTKALAIGHHGGAGKWNIGDNDRFGSLGVDVKPWRSTGDDILLLPQRSIGEPGLAMPRNWEAQAMEKLSRMTDRRIRVRKHPGKDRDALRLEDDLDGVYCAVTWASGAGIKCICQGVPVFHELGTWIGRGAASLTLDIEKPFMGDSLAMLHNLAYAQWSMNEIESGEAFKFLLEGNSNER